MQFCDRAWKRCVSLQYVQVIRRKRHICHLVKKKIIGGTKKEVLGSPVLLSKVVNSAVARNPDQDTARYWSFYRMTRKKILILYFLEWPGSFQSYKMECSSTCSDSLIFSSTLVSAKNWLCIFKKCHWEGFSVAICSRLSDERHNMLSRHRVISSRREHIVMASS